VRLACQKRHRPGLLAGRASGDPNAERGSPCVPPLRVETGKDLVAQQIDLGGVAEEIGFVDQHPLDEIDPISIAWGCGDHSLDIGETVPFLDASQTGSHLAEGIGGP
jgi:hypothetical protein